MQRVSTNLTLFYKLFIPTFWTVFFGAFTLAMLLLRYEYVGGFPRAAFQGLVLAAFAGSLLLLYVTLIPLKRVEMDAHSVYVTNYFRHFRYSFDSIEKITTRHYGLWRTVTIHLYQPGSFGPRMTFVPSLGRLRDFLHDHPQMRALFPDGARSLIP
jgi:hypothetical protein